MTHSPKPLRLAISGTYSTGKTTTTEALCLWVGLERTQARTMREILPEALPGKALEDCSFPQLFQLGVMRFTERAVREATMRGSFVSDGSSLHEWVYGTARLKVGINPNNGPVLRTLKKTLMLPHRKLVSEINEAFGAVVKHHASRHYDEFVHLPVEFPLVKDGHRPVSEEFRATSDQLLLQTLKELKIPYRIVGGTIEERLIKIAELYGLSPIMPLDEAIREAKSRVRTLLSTIETDAQNAALRRQSMDWRGRLRHRLAMS